MQSVNREQFLGITFLFQLCGALAISVFGTVTVPLTIMYSSLYSYKLAALQC